MNYPVSELLKKEFEARKSRWAQLSLRSFAKKIGLSPSSLSKIFSGTQSLSREKAYIVAGNLGMTPDDIEKFCNTADIFVRSKKTKNKSLITEYDIQVFDLIARWHHIVILEWVSMKGVEADPIKIATGLGLPLNDVKSSLKTLLQLKLIKAVKPKGYLVTNKSQNFGDGSPARAIREFHQQMIEKASRAIEEQSPDERYLSSSVIKVSKKNYAKIVSKLKKFRDEVCVLSEDDLDADKIYALNIQLFTIAKVK